ncbi:Pimeloyl-ACP methyl ester carboxylesterase [Saccharicrinis carchari]|uniref:Pimeloyl-ACP methyl ester carboxylesterase n=1 Tax=Saccharicrinis carchari TaxID=1168039 RepID=A0A521CL88_SACCC|nr:alpha/beta fold hydrolase [Saccharicrinis carchari]SMO59491.1 Pimeloyl-ACP methyl ester carboxylesterase [Saccharicrinis carchari]
MELFFRELGKGDKNLIIIHGLYGSSDNWLSVARMLEDKFRIFIVDQRNHGQSPHSNEMDYNSMAEDIKTFMQQRQLKKANIMGHSMGGKTAMLFALKNPLMVDKLVVLDIAPKYYNQETNYGRITSDHRAIVDALLAVDPSEHSSRNAIGKVLKQSIPNNMVRSFLLKNVERGKDKQYYWKLNVQAISDNLDKIMNGVPEFEDTEEFPSQKTVVMIRGAKSPYVQDEDMQLVRKYFPSAQLADIPDAGHWLHTDQPDLFIKTLDYFLS